MALWTIEDLRAAIGDRACLQCLDDDKDGTEDAAAVASVQRDADAITLGYLTTEYSALAFIPPASVPDTVKMLSLNIGCHVMYERKPEFIDAEGKSPAWGRYSRAVDLLKSMKKSGFRLDTNGTPARPLNVQGEVRTGTYTNNVPTGPGFIKDGTGDGGF